MKKTDNKNYLLFGFIGLVIIGAVAVLSQNSGQLFQGDLIRSVSTYPGTTTSPTVSTTSYTTDQTQQSLSRIEKKIDNLTNVIQAQNTKIDNLASSLTTVRKKVNYFSEKIAYLIGLTCNSLSSSIASSCNSTYTQIKNESDKL